MAVSRTHKDALMVCAYQLVETYSDLVLVSTSSRTHKDALMTCAYQRVETYSDLHKDVSAAGGTYSLVSTVDPKTHVRLAIPPPF